MKLRLNDVIEVSWDDIVTHSVWLEQNKAEKESVCKCMSTGYFLNEDKRVLRLSCTVQQGDRQERDLTVIPKGCITKIVRLKQEKGK